MRVIAVMLCAMAASPALACGVETDCALGDRSYRIAMPEGAEAPGALIYAHGYKGSSRGAMRNKAMIEFAQARGLALVALNALGDDWRIPGVPQDPSATGEEALAYADAVIADLSARHGIDTDRLIVTGFSAGGMMTWYLACHRGDRFRAFLPIAGTFWAPVPPACPSFPVDMVHIHGLSDRIVPLAGRQIAQTRQGDVLQALQLLGTTAGASQDVARTVEEGELTCTLPETASGRTLGFCTHDGGHSFKVAYLASAYGLLKEAGVLSAP